MPALNPTPRTVADLLRHLGDLPADRVRFVPTPGTATEADLLALLDHEDVICELIDGVLVEKPTGFLESYLGIEVARLLGNFVNQNDLGIVAGADGMMRLTGGQVRIPDVSFIGWHQLPGGVVPRTPIPDLYPDLAVEILSTSNTLAEMRRKRHEYFAAGTRLVWQIDPATRTAAAYTAPDAFTERAEADALDGTPVLPGFTLPLAGLFARAERP